MHKILIVAFLLTQTLRPQTTEELAQRYSAEELHERFLLSIGFAYGFAIAATKFDNGEEVLQHSCKNLKEADALLAEALAKGLLLGASE